MQRPHVLMTCGLVALVAAACARELPGDSPPEKSFYFPISLALAPDGRHVYVVSANFDKRYNAGWVSTVDLDVAVPTDGSFYEGVGAIREGQLKVPELAGTMAIDETGTLAVLPHRGDPVLTLIDIEVGGFAITCGDDSVAGALDGLRTDQLLTSCDRRHLVDLDPDVRRSLRRAGYLSDDDVIYDDPKPKSDDVADPFSVAVFTYRPAGGEPPVPLIAVGHLATTQLSIFRYQPSSGVGHAARLSPGRLIGLDRSGVSALRPHPDASGSFLAATSRAFGGLAGDSSLIYSIDVGRSLEEDRDRVARFSINLHIGGRDMAGMAFSPDGSRFFAANQSPDSLVVLDATLETVEEVQADGTILRVARPRYDLLSAAAIPGRPADVVYLPRATDDPDDDLVAVGSFDENAVYLLTVIGDDLQLVGRLEGVGQGPFSLLPVRRNGRDLLIVAAFYDHALSIFDLTAKAPTAARQVAFIQSEETEPVDRAR
ncbi:MAG: hypothetical protein V3T05_08910 [Myxococcota bacterium]